MNQSTPAKKISKPDQEKVRRDLWTAILAAEEAPGMDLKALEIELREQADRLWRKDYNSMVAGIVDEMLEEAKHRPDAYLSDYILEQADGNHYIIYTHQAALVLTNSDNADAWEDEPSIYENTSQRAYAALEADIRDEMEGRGLDVQAEKLGDLLAADDAEA